MEVKNCVYELIELAQEGEYEKVITSLSQLNLEDFSEQEIGCIVALEVVCQDRIGEEELLESFVPKILEERKKDFYFLNGVGIILSDLDEYNYARQILSELVEQQPESAIAYYNLGLVLERSKDLEAAITAYNKVIALEPVSELYQTALLRKSESLYELKRFEEAGNTCKQYLKLNPENSSVWLLLAMLEGYISGYEEATLAYERSSQLTPECTEIYFHWAITAFNHKDREKIAQLLKQLDTITPNDWTTKMVCACLKEMDGDIESGWESCYEACQVAIATGESYIIDTVVVSALHYAHRNELRVYANKLLKEIKEIKERNIFSEKIFLALRKLEGKWSNCCNSYFVLVKGMGIKKLEETDHELKANEGKSSLQPYLRGYGVYAENQDEAIQTALLFESERGGQSLIVDSLKKDFGQYEQYLGVWKTTGGRRFYEFEE